jgi:hypothetical protein
MLASALKKAACSLLCGLGAYLLIQWLWPEISPSAFTSIIGFAALGGILLCSVLGWTANTAMKKTPLMPRKKQKRRG